MWPARLKYFGCCCGGYSAPGTRSLQKIWRRHQFNRKRNLPNISPYSRQHRHFLRPAVHSENVGGEAKGNVCRNNNRGPWHPAFRTSKSVLYAMAGGIRGAIEIARKIREESRILTSVARSMT